MKSADPKKTPSAEECFVTPELEIMECLSESEDCTISLLESGKSPKC